MFNSRTTDNGLLFNRWKTVKNIACSRHCLLGSLASRLYQICNVDLVNSRDATFLISVSNCTTVKCQCKYEVLECLRNKCKIKYDQAYLVKDATSILMTQLCQYLFDCTISNASVCFKWSLKEMPYKT